MAAGLLLMLFIGCVVTAAMAVSNCFQCREVESPALCLHNVSCSLHEKCFTEKFVSQSGHTFYNLDCKHERVCQVLEHLAVGRSVDSGPVVTVCSQCCDDSLCNKALC